MMSHNPKNSANKNTILFSKTPKPRNNNGIRTLRSSCKNRDWPKTTSRPKRKGRNHFVKMPSDLLTNFLRSFRNTTIKLKSTAIETFGSSNQVDCLEAGVSRSLIAITR